jgi:hypothetical protein
MRAISAPLHRQKTHGRQQLRNGEERFADNCYSSLEYQAHNESGRQASCSAARLPHCPTQLLLKS